MNRVSLIVALSFILFNFEIAASEKFNVEPPNQKYGIRGYANGVLDTKQDKACFRIDSLKIELKPAVKETQEILGFNFGIATPWDLDHFDFVAKTKTYQIKRVLSKENPIVLKNIEMCLESPWQGRNANSFITLEILLKHDNRLGYATTYAHEKEKYEKYMSRRTVFPEVFSLTANSGEFEARTLAHPSTTSSISASLRLTAFNASKKWPAAAYVGFHQGENRDNSLQFLILKRHSDDSYVVSGYRVISNGQEVSVNSIENIPLDAKARVNLSFDQGSVTLQTGETEPIRIRTSLTKVSPYVSVSSGTAEFSVGP